MHVLLPFALLVQQAIAPTTPPSRDTVGYWQQEIAYRIVARLDERAQSVHASGTLRYVNHSPDTLRVMWFHQYLNAFRPGSRWSAVDEREGRVRFQTMRDPDYAYERFTSVPTFDGATVRPEYPIAPDSTIVRFTLPRPLAPGDSVTVRFAWDARPSARIYRRQGRRGREYDFAQWYPKVAVYDRLGWEENPLVPAGELYGEFGTYDVTLILPEDDVVGATGVPVEGDPGWERVKQWGTVDLARTAYGDVPPDTTVSVPAGFRRVRFLARDVHHFAWTVSPDFRYEGTLYRGSIPVHVLYDSRGAARWGQGQAVGMIVRALQWLESIYGPYAYPQVTGTQRLEGGATEFPMMVMYGGMSPGLALHETGHIYTYGFLANNEWRSGWMDEGLTSYQTAWALLQTRPEAARRGVPPPAGGTTGYRARAVRPSSLDAQAIEQFRLDLLGRAQPVGTPAYAFREFGIYNQMVYTRAQMMYAALRDAIGDSAFRAFLHDYYARWKFKHVDELAMRASAERAAGRDLGWFFDQWVHRTGLVDYAVRDVRVTRQAGGWRTRARVERVGEYRQPMIVGVRADGAWHVARVSPDSDAQWIELFTSERPSAAEIDPQREEDEWDRRDDAPPFASTPAPPTVRTVLDWPFLNQWLADREVAAIRPLLWYTAPGGVTAALRLRTNYQGWLDRWEMGVAVPVREPAAGRSSRLQGWVLAENPDVPFTSRPLIGVRLGAWALDGIAKLGLEKRWDASPYYYANGPRVHWTLGAWATLPYDSAWSDPARWDDARVLEGRVTYDWAGRSPAGLGARAALAGGLVDPRASPAGQRGFTRVDLEGRKLARFGASGRGVGLVRVYLAASDGAPTQRAIGVSALDATDTFGDHLLRGRGAPFAREDVHYAAIGDGAMRAYSPLLRVRNLAALNAELGAALNTPARGSLLPRIWASVFADGGGGTMRAPGAGTRGFADAGVSLSLRGALYDQPYVLRVDVPVYAYDADPVGGRMRWAWGIGALW